MVRSIVFTLLVMVAGNASGGFSEPGFRPDPGSAAGAAPRNNQRSYFGADMPPPAVGSAGGDSECEDARDVRNVYFGDLHIHTALSHDAFAFGIETGVEGAYEASRQVLDFAAVTDHAEFLAETNVCQQEWSSLFDSEVCESLRSGIINFSQLEEICQNEDPLLTESMCVTIADKLWTRAQVAANMANTDCEFTAFIGYEYSLGAGATQVLHRNVIFAGDSVPDRVVSSFDEDTPEGLWEVLRDTCTGDCEVLAIPHNSNRSEGEAFVSEGMTEEIAALRVATEPLVEIFQHKGSSECYPYIGNEDEGCAFEQFAPSQTSPSSSSEPARLSFVREALKDGLALGEELGVNPFRFGLIGSTDTHNAVGGITEEASFEGHVGDRDDRPEGRMTGPMKFNNPGGLTGVWATQNTRRALFDALLRREVFATSGSRLAVRFFGGWQYPAEVCEDEELLSTAFEGGMPMGGELRSAPGVAPVFIAIAQRDPLSEKLAEIQVVKGWVADEGTAETVISIASYEDQSGAELACVRWEDPDFDASRSAFYYLRVLELPTARWSTLDCAVLGVDCSEPDSVPSGMAACCDGTLPETIQERAWSSPIWYRP